MHLLVQIKTEIREKNIKKPSCNKLKKKEKERTLKYQLLQFLPASDLLHQRSHSPYSTGNTLQS